MLPMPDYRLDLDLSELDGKEYRCLDGCALCCLCQPELLPDEERKLRGDPVLSAGLADKHISPDVRGTAIKLQGAHGACHFLRNRRCAIYGQRPHYCRAFPISVFSGWRIQLNANLSCRGIGLAGEGLRATGERLLETYGAEVMEEELRGSRQVFLDFSGNTRDAKVSQSVQSLRGAAQALIDDMTDEQDLSRLLTYAESGSTKQNSSAQEIARKARNSEPEADILDLAVAIGTELFDLPDMSYLPVYVDEDLVWRIFKLEGDSIIGYVLSEDGSIEEFSRTEPAEVVLLPFSAEGKAAFEEYLRVVNNRDCFLGHAAHLLDMDGYGHNFAQAYLGALGNGAVDLWWRSSFLAALRGTGTLDSTQVREGIVFFDMDQLDQPTIGAFL